MAKFILTFFLSTVIFLFIDFLWLTVIAKSFYRTHLGHLLAEKPQLWAAGIFYLIFMIGLVVFVLAPSLNASSSVRALLLGALYGLVTYATYDLTNQATLKDWPISVTIIDLCWGAGLTGTVSYLVVTIVRYLDTRFGL